MMGRVGSSVVAVSLLFAALFLPVEMAEMDAVFKVKGMVVNKDAQFKVKDENAMDSVFKVRGMANKDAHFKVKDNAVPGTLFKIRGDDHQVCGLLRTEVNITITARKGSKVLGAASFTDADPANFITGDCFSNLTLHLGGRNVTWSFREYLRFDPTIDYMVTRAVTFVPFKVFGGGVASSNTTKLFGNHEDAVIGRPSQSYFCTTEDKSYYIEPRGQRQNPVLSYTVLVDVKYLRFQYAYVKKEQFSDAHTCHRPS